MRIEPSAKKDKGGKKIMRHLAEAHSSVPHLSYTVRPQPVNGPRGGLHLYAKES